MRVAGQPAVLRVDEPAARRLGLDRVAELDVLRAVAAAGLGPACVAADPARGTLLTEWLPGRALSGAELREPARLRQAAALLARVHGLPPFGPTPDLAAAVRRYAALSPAIPVEPSLETDALEQLARCLAAEPPDTPRLCHLDPTPGNFIAGADGSLRLIDWEYAGLAPPAVDLAGLALGAGLDPAGDEALLAAYRGRPPGPEEIGRHRAWKRFCGQLNRLWAAALGD